VSEHAKKLIVSDKRRYLEKIADVGSDPYCISAAQLSKEVIPSVQSRYFNYLSTSFCTSQMFKAFKSLDAYIYFECGFANCLGIKQINSKTVTVAKIYV